MKLFGVGLFAVSFLVATGSGARAAESEVTVTGASVNVRSAPSKSASVLRQAKAGETFPLVETTGEWYAVELPGGPRGFLHRSVARVSPGASGSQPGAPADAAGPAPTTPGAASATRPGGFVGIAHESIDCVVADRFPQVEARLDPAERVARARARFRVAGAVHWYSVEMKAQEGVWKALLPKPKKQTPRIEYYIEAIDTEFGASQTAEHGADVVGSPAECSKKVVAAALSAGKVAVTAPAGAPPVPAGFSSSGVTSTSPLRTRRSRSRPRTRRPPARVEPTPSRPRPETSGRGTGPRCAFRSSSSARAGTGGCSASSVPPSPSRPRAATSTCPRSTTTAS